MRQERAYHSLLAVLVLAPLLALCPACAGPSVRLYDGPERPVSEVATIVPSNPSDRGLTYVRHVSLLPPDFDLSNKDKVVPPGTAIWSKTAGESGPWADPASRIDLLPGIYGFSCRRRVSDTGVHLGNVGVIGGTKRQIHEEFGSLRCAVLAGRLYQLRSSTIDGKDVFELIDIGTNEEP